MASAFGPYRRLCIVHYILFLRLIIICRLAFGRFQQVILKQKSLSHIERTVVAINLTGSDGVCLVESERRLVISVDKTI